MAICTKCKADKPSDQFHRRANGSLKSWCRSCIGEASLDAIHDKRDRLAAIKVERGCADCSYNEHAVALDFDHVRGEKIESVSRLVTRSWDRILTEIAKCDVVCANCHRVRTQAREQANG